MYVPICSKFFIEKAAIVCYERAIMWKEKEQESLEYGLCIQARNYQILCNEADDCKAAIRRLIADPTEQQIVKAIADLTDSLCSITTNNDIKRVVLGIQKQMGGLMVSS